MQRAVSWLGEPSRTLDEISASEQSAKISGVKQSGTARTRAERVQGIALNVGGTAGYARPFGDELFLSPFP